MKHKLKGFTLIELIVVIAIIAILATILIPSMMGFMEKARISRMNANARSIYSGATLAIVDTINSGHTVKPDCIYTGSNDCMGHPDGGGDICDLTNYLGEKFDGYFAFKTSSQGMGCIYAMWSDYPISAQMAQDALTEKEVAQSLGTANPIGCHPLKSDDDGT